ncbi:hypothetical protein C5749_11575 [Sphingobacterium gobiense]|uniref:Uncharacterized protein n=1 Tax=Sphingobacterium gobiense TaxID=1382456 RepID=A0A2S9JLT9_9SPHI|nr:hypothetical protein C5749_11575 [Sphingobacterium gobiense]
MHLYIGYSKQQLKSQLFLCIIILLLQNIIIATLYNTEVTNKRSKHDIKNIISKSKNLQIHYLFFNFSALFKKKLF